ncbi:MULTISPECIES: hypothetical protein [unclassified Ruegeria]|uniref:hypothetical protein n=1 Tax=unclassified Ruegeria TaxID=2625375 RepID=UPI001487BA6F|nr:MULTISPECIES: hypothetical protein [unclassified Ruegeria]
MKFSFLLVYATGVLDRAKKTSWLNWVIILVMLAMLAVWVVYPNFTKRTYVLSVETAGLQLRFTRSLTNTSWQFSDVLLCERREKRERDPETESARCEAELFTERRIKDAEIGFEKGANVLIERDPQSGELSISVLDSDSLVSVNGEIVPGRSLLKIEPRVLRDAGALAFTAEVIIGQVATTGETGIVSSGNYGILEQRWLRSLTGEGAVQVRSGQFFRGDEIKIVNASQQDKAIEVTGFLAPFGQSIAVQLTSPMGKNALRIDRIGSEFSIIRSDAINRIEVDPVFQAMSWAVFIVLSLLKLADWLRPPQEQNDAPEKPEKKKVTQE